MCFNEIPLHNLCSKFCCSIFKDRCAGQVLLVCDFSIILYQFPFVKPFLKTFLSFFGLFSVNFYSIHAKKNFTFLLGCSISIPFDFGLVKGFFIIFSWKFIFRQTVLYIQKKRRLYEHNAQSASAQEKTGREFLRSLSVFYQY